jgi:glycosyltransferase involved in cell wall biosynthesis
MTPFLSTEAPFDANDPSFRAVRLVEVELCEPIPAIEARKGDRHYQHAQIMVRLFTCPIGRVTVDLDANELDSNILADFIWRALHTEINVWLEENGLSPLAHLDVTGLKTGPTTPAFLMKRTQLLEDAPFISVIVCTRDRTDQLRLALSGLLELAYPNFEILVVDNAPRTNETADLVQHAFNAIDKIRYVREDRPGLSFARNCGLQHARGKYVAYTDDDAVADRHWLAEIARGFDMGDHVACVTGPMIPPELDTPVQLIAEQFRGRDMKFTRRIFDRELHRSQDPLYPWAAGIYGGGGANMSFRTSVLHEVGGFDPALGTGTPTHGGEDLAMFVELVTRGYQIAYEPGAIVYHAHRADYSALLTQLYGYGVGLTAYLMRFILNRPASLLDILPKVGKAVYYMLDPKSTKNHKRTVNYPAELSKAELRGMIFGPIAYLQSRRLMREKKP